MGEVKREWPAGPLPGSLLDRLRPRRIVALRTGRLGDVLLASPALRALRRAAPGARTTLLVDRVALPVGERIASVDEVIVVPPLPGLHWEGLPFAAEAEVEAFFAQMRARHFDLALQLKGAGDTTNAFVQRLGARVTAGQRGARAPALDLDMPYTPLQPEVLRLLDVVRLIGAPEASPQLEITVRPDDLDELHALPELDWNHLLRRRVIGLNIGARSGARCWALERYRAVVARLLAETEYDIVLLGGPRERERADALAASLGHPARLVNLAGRTSVGGLIALVACLRLLITNDSFPGHLAAAFDTPAVIIFGNGHPAQWGPLCRVRQRPVADYGAPCRLPGAACGCHDNSSARCLAGISVEMVLAQVRDLLAMDARLERIPSVAPVPSPDQTTADAALE